MNFRKKIQRITQLMAGLQQRGYCCEQLQDDDPNVQAFVSPITEDLSIRLLFSEWDETRFQVSIMLASKAVADKYNGSLRLNDPIPQFRQPEVVISVRMLWLRWNHNPGDAETFRFDYEFGSEFGTQRVFEDLDSVGKDFISSVSTQYSLARRLFELNSYPKNIKWGGKPVSVDQYIYAAILFAESGNIQAARDALDRGLDEYNLPEPRLLAHERRFSNFQIRRELLIEQLHAQAQKH